MTTIDNNSNNGQNGGSRYHNEGLTYDSFCRAKNKRNPGNPISSGDDMAQGSQKVS